PLIEHAPEFPWPESARMLAALLKGQRPVAGVGWFGPGQSRYGWEGARARFDAGGDGRVARAGVRGPRRLVDRPGRGRGRAAAAGAGAGRGPGPPTTSPGRRSRPPPARLLRPPSCSAPWTATATAG